MLFCSLWYLHSCVGHTFAEVTKRGYAQLPYQFQLKSATCARIFPLKAVYSQMEGVYWVFLGSMRQCNPTPLGLLFLKCGWRVACRTHGLKTESALLFGHLEPWGLRAVAMERRTSWQWGLVVMLLLWGLRWGWRMSEWVDNRYQGIRSWMC